MPGVVVHKYSFSLENLRSTLSRQILDFGSMDYYLRRSLLTELAKQKRKAADSTAPGSSQNKRPKPEMTPEGKAKAKAKGKAAVKPKPKAK